MVVAEGVSTPEEVDRIWRLSTGTALGPFRIMDRIGLDVALAVEEHYATIRDGIPAAPRELPEFCKPTGPGLTLRLARCISGSNRG